MNQPARVVWFEQRFEAEVRAIQPDVKRVDEARRYLDWVLAYHPERGLPADYPGVFIAPLRLPRFDGVMVDASVFNIYDEAKVYVLSIKLPPAGH